jgi:hypothetical protein
MSGGLSGRVYFADMRAWRLRICALVLALATLPGAVESLENLCHLVARGHSAHALAAHGDRHEAGPEHGCTPTFHFCGCHASLVILGSQILPPIHLRAAGSPGRLDPDPGSKGFWPAIDRPPRA